MSKIRSFVQANNLTLFAVCIGIIIALILNIIYLHSPDWRITPRDKVSIEDFKGTYEFGFEPGLYLSISPENEFFIQNNHYEDNVTGYIKQVPRGDIKDLIYRFDIDDKSNYLVFDDDQLLWISETYDEVFKLRKINEAFFIFH